MKNQMGGEKRIEEIQNYRKILDNVKFLEGQEDFWEMVGGTGTKGEKVLHMDRLYDFYNVRNFFFFSNKY